MADSIREVGLFHPVVTTEDGSLIAGQRRLEACRLLGWQEVPVTVIDMAEVAIGQQHENLVRKDLLPSEIVALKRFIEPVERDAAKARQGQRSDLEHPAIVAGCDGGEVRNKIARYLGVGRTTIDRAEKVVQAAEENPEEFGHLVAQMDRRGKVAGVFRRLLVLRQSKELEAAPPPLPDGPFRVIVADPPWHYEGGCNLPYPTMPLEAIRAMPVSELAEDDSLLWL